MPSLSIFLSLLLIQAACAREPAGDAAPAGPSARAVLIGDLMVPLTGSPDGAAPTDPEHRIARRTLRRAAAPIAWPYEDVDISSPYGFRIHPTLQTVKMHRGLDFPRGLGTPVLSLADGTVQKVMYDGVYGNVVFVDHEGGWQSVYAHLSEITVLPDEAVEAGALVGLTGSTGRSTGSHLHLGVLVDGRSVDPLYFIGRTWSQDRLSDGPIPSFGKTEPNASPAAIDDPYSGD
jgi:murein DD-endopeptidase MepM/ murein hydrolase activator NlpD